ncbi:MAG: histone deacetylase family protein [bacterium]
MKFIYSDRYTADLMGHIFPIEKYKLIYERLLFEGIITDENHIVPQIAEWDDIALVHTREYIDDMRNLRQTMRTAWSEMALTREIIDAFRLGTGGTIEAMRWAVRGQGSANIGGGLHHAFPDHAEGFCYINDIAVGIRVVQRDGFSGKVLIVDADLHQGNGTAVIFADDPTVFTFSIHQEKNYPVKQKSDYDVGLRDLCGDDEYLRLLKKSLDDILSQFTPDIIVYVAGADPYIDDQLGGLALTFDGLAKRDEIVISTAKKLNVPVVILLAGGYAHIIDDTVEIQANTLRIGNRYYKD